MPGYTVRAVAERLGIPTATFRSWTQRYDIGPRTHRPGQHRLYSEADIAALEQMVALIHRGVSPASAARFMRQAIPAGRSVRGIIGTDVLDAVIDAAERVDSAGLVELIDSTLARHGVVATWNQLCRLAFRIIEQRQHAQGGCIDIEHALSWAVSASLAKIDHPDSAAGTSIRIVLACSPGELHSLPLQALRAALTEQSAVVHMIGADVPTRAARDAQVRTDADAVVVWSQTAATADPAALEISGTARIFAAGPGWTLTDLPPGILLLDDLDAALVRLPPPDSGGEHRDRRSDPGPRHDADMPQQ